MDITMRFDKMAELFPETAAGAFNDWKKTSRSYRNLEKLSNASWFAYWSINYYIENTPESDNIFKTGVKASIEIDPISKLASVHLTKDSLSSRVTYFSMKDENEYIWFDFKYNSLSLWLLTKFGYGKDRFFFKKSKEFYEDNFEDYNDEFYDIELLDHMSWYHNNHTIMFNVDEEEFFYLAECFNINPAIYTTEILKTFNHKHFLYDVDKTIVNKKTIEKLGSVSNSYQFHSYEENFEKIFDGGIIGTLADTRRPLIPLAIAGNIMDFIDPMKVTLELQISLEGIKIDTRSELRSYASDAAHPFHEALKTKALNKTTIIVGNKNDFDDAEDDFDDAED